MSTNLEIEAKSIINEEQYNRLSNANNIKEKYTQINYYILPYKNVKEKRQFGLRIRYKNHKYELTLKTPKYPGKLEINDNISVFSYLFFKVFGVFPKGDVKEYILSKKLCDIKELKIIGKMITERSDILFRDSLISVDKSSYNNHVDFEVECEGKTQDSALNDLLEFLNENNIEYKKSEFTKLARFVNSL